MAVHPLLAHCARLQSDAAHQARLAELAAGVEDWAALLAEAERHGLGPLLHWHLRASHAPVPQEVRRTLQAGYIRHRHANRVRLNLLAQVLRAYAEAGLEVRVVKGGALAHLLYPDPTLRPMSDLDLLVRPADLPRAREALSTLGLTSGPAEASPDKSLPTVGRQIEGVWVGVELHQDLFEPGFPASLTLEGLSEPPLPFATGVEGVIGHTLGYEELLWHLCQHLRFHATVFLPWRLIWVADIVGLVERFAAQLDWERMARRYPEALDTLSLLHWLTPLPQSLLVQVRLPLGVRPSGVGEDFDGWPRHALAAQRAKGWRGVLRNTLWPAEWWLRLHGGLSAAAPLWRRRWLQHPLEIAGWGCNLIAGEVRRRARLAARRTIAKGGIRHAHP